MHIINGVYMRQQLTDYVCVRQYYVMNEKNRKHLQTTKQEIMIHHISSLLTDKFTQINNTIIREITKPKVNKNTESTKPNTKLWYMSIELHVSSMKFRRRIISRRMSNPLRVSWLWSSNGRWSSTCRKIRFIVTSLDSWLGLGNWTIGWILKSSFSLIGKTQDWPQTEQGKETTTSPWAGLNDASIISHPPFEQFLNVKRPSTSTTMPGIQFGLGWTLHTITWSLASHICERARRSWDNFCAACLSVTTFSGQSKLNRVR